MIGGPQIILIIIVVLLLFGGRKIPELMRGLGSGIKEFKKATKEEEEETTREGRESKETRKKWRPLFDSLPTNTKQKLKSGDRRDPVEDARVGLWGSSFSDTRNVVRGSKDRRHLPEDGFRGQAP